MLVGIAVKSSGVDILRLHEKTITKQHPLAVDFSCYPLPLGESKSSASGSFSSMPLALSRMAWAGMLTAFLESARKTHQSIVIVPIRCNNSVICGCPSVNVPVLSTTTVSPSCVQGLPHRGSAPPGAAANTTMIDMGVARPRRKGRQ